MRRIYSKRRAITTRQADTVAVVDVGDVKALLAEDGTWVHTRLTGVVRDVLKSVPSRRVSRGDILACEVSDGELRIGKVIVRAGGVIRYPSKGRYVMFVKYDDGFGTPNAVLGPKLIRGRTVGSLSVDAVNPLHGLSLNDVLEAVRKGAN